MGLFHTRHLTGQCLHGSEQGVGLGSSAMAVVDGVNGRNGIPAAEDVIGPHGSEILVNQISGMVVGQRDAAAQVGRAVGAGHNCMYCSIAGFSLATGFSTPGRWATCRAGHRRPGPR